MSTKTYSYRFKFRSPTTGKRRIKWVWANDLTEAKMFADIPAKATHLTYRRN